jgi:hypothetical protein
MIDPQGRARTLPARQLELAQQQGFRLAENADEVAIAQEREKVAEEATQGVMGGVNSLVEGIARAIPGADYLARKGNELLLGEEQADLVNEAVKARSKTGLATAGEVAGTLALALGTGGASTAARGGGMLAKVAAKNPVALINSGSELAGKAAEKLVARAIPSQAIGSILAKGAALGTEGALQGMAVQVGHNINEAALGDHELNAERLLAGMPEAAMFGGAFGAGLGLGAGAVSTAGKGLAAVGKKLGAVDRPALLDKAIDKFADASAVVSGKPAADIKTALKNRSVRMDAVNYDDLSRVAVEKSVAGLDAIQKLEKVERQLAAGEFKAQNVAKFVRTGPDVVVSAAAKLDELDALARELAPVVDEALPKAKPRPSAMAEAIGPKNAETVRKIIDGGRARFEAARKSATPEADAFLAIEDMNRSIGKLSRDAQKAFETGAGGDPLRIAQTRKLFEVTEAARRDVRGFLENTDVWGQAATNQQRRNSAISEYLNTKRDFDNRFFVRTSERGDPEMWALAKKEADAGKLDQYFRSLDDWKKSKSHEQTLRHLDAKENLLKTLEEIGEVPPELAKQFTEARGHNQTFRASIAEMGERLGNANMIRKLAQSDDQAGALMSAVGGHVLGGPLGAAAGFAMNALANPGRVVNKVIQIEALAQQLKRFDGKAAGALKAFVRGSGDVATQAEPRAMVRIGRKVADARRVTVGRLAADKDAGVKAYQRRAKQVQAMAADPELAVNAASRIADGLESVAPKTAQAVLQAHINTVAYLDSLIARPPASLRSPSRRAAWRPSPAEMTRFDRAYRAIVDPLSTLSDLKAGTVTMDAVNALKATRPRVWDHLRLMAQETVAQHGEQLDYGAVTRLSLAFDFAGDATLDPGFIARHQALISQAPEGEGQPEGATPAPQATNIPSFSAAVQTQPEKIAAAL